MFFFEKKNQKTFITLGYRRPTSDDTNSRGISGKTRHPSLTHPKTLAKRAQTPRRL